MNRTLTSLRNLPAIIMAGLLIVIAMGMAGTILAVPTDNELLVEKGALLIAKRKLHGTSFQQTVILITHYSSNQVVGFTLNRPTDVTLSQAFPDVSLLKDNTDLVYLGGPVQPEKIYVLLRTKQPGEGMHHIIDNVYFSSVKHAFSSPSEKITRTFSGFAGWTARQLQNEIHRGDWQVIHTNIDDIFDKNTFTLWEELFNQWAGEWT